MAIRLEKSLVCGHMIERPCPEPTLPQEPADIEGRVRVRDHPMIVGQIAPYWSSRAEAPALKREEADHGPSFFRNRDHHVVAHRCHCRGELGAKVGAREAGVRPL